jgi:predicted ATPase/class 3 adenylate cyclase
MSDGIRTMLFTDVEGSTRLARACGDGWPAIVADHHRLVGGAIEDRGGQVVRTAGDAFFALFADPVAAAEAAADAQRALAAHPWPRAVGELRVRMGLHTGRVEQTGADELAGLDIHLAARVEAAANGGQVVMTAATRDALPYRLPTESLGEHRLKDFPQAEHLYLLVHDGRRAADFPPLRTGPARPTNLPADTRDLLGRDGDLAALRRLLVDEGARLVTLLGLGGTGKTRLALAAGASLLSDFEGGVWFVPLAGVREPEAVLPAIAHALNVKQDPGRPLADALADRLAARPALLVLDNLEQLVDAAPLIGGVLDRAPEARALVTSQLPLRVAMEHPYRLDPLGHDPAIELFARRAASALGGFDLDAERESVEAICARLDGMPLAIELAAARVALMPPRELRERLDHSLGILARGPRDLEERHRSLRKTLEWTVGLLEEDERRLFARLAVFAGPAPLDAVEAVCGDDALDALAGLVDASLARRLESREHGVRFMVPQAARDFAAELLEASGEAHALRAAHASHVAQLAEACRLWYPGHTDAARARVLALRDEQPIALEWSRAYDAAVHLRVASALGAVMTRTGRHAQARLELEFALARTEIAGVEAGWAACVHAWVLFNLSRTDEALARIEAGVQALRKAGDDHVLTLALRAMGVIHQFLGRHETAAAATGEAVERARRSGDATLLAGELIFHHQSLSAIDREGAARCLAEAEALASAARGDSTLAGAIADARAEDAFDRGDWATAAPNFAEAAAQADELDSTEQVLSDLYPLIYVLVQLGELEAAVDVAALSEVLVEETGEPYFLGPHVQERVAGAIARAHAAVGPAGVAAALASARAVPPAGRAAHIRRLGAVTRGVHA